MDVEEITNLVLFKHFKFIAEPRQRVSPEVLGSTAPNKAKACIVLLRGKEIFSDPSRNTAIAPGFADEQFSKIGMAGIRVPGSFFVHKHHQADGPLRFD